MTERFMMATTAIHKIGDISREKPDLAVILTEDADNYIGRWVTGFGFVNVRFPKATTRDLTAEEREFYAGKHLVLAGMVYPSGVEVTR